MLQNWWDIHDLEVTVEWMRHICQQPPSPQIGTEIHVQTHISTTSQLSFLFKSLKKKNLYFRSLWRLNVPHFHCFLCLNTEPPVFIRPLLLFCSGTVMSGRKTYQKEKLIAGFENYVFLVVCTSHISHLISCATIKPELLLYFIYEEKKQHVHSRNISVISNFCQIHKAFMGPVVQI